MKIFSQPILHSVSPMKSNNWCVGLLTNRFNIRSLWTGFQNIYKSMKKNAKNGDKLDCDCCLGSLECFTKKQYNISCHFQPLELHTIYIAYLTGKFVWNDFGLKEVWQLVIYSFMIWNFLEMLKSYFLTLNFCFGT